MDYKNSKLKQAPILSDSSAAIWWYCLTILQTGLNWHLSEGKDIVWNETKLSFIAYLFSIHSIQLYTLFNYIHYSVIHTILKKVD